MKLIRKIRTEINKNGNKLYYGEFLCLFCLKRVEKQISNGLKQESCGCNKKYNKNNNPNYKHGEYGTRLYNIWRNIKKRCSNLNDENYGGRGITVCPEWTNDYTKFRDWSLSNGYKEELQIDRKETNGNYEPSNCRWVTNAKNCQNKRNNVIKSMEEANEIRELYKTGNYTQQELGKKFNVGQDIINYIVNNKKWKACNL